MRDPKVADLDRERERARPDEVGLTPESGARHAFRLDAMLGCHSAGNVNIPRPVVTHEAVRHQVGLGSDRSAR